MISLCFAMTVLVAVSPLAYEPIGEIRIRSSRTDQSTRAWQRSLIGMDRPSERTNETLVRFGLADLYDQQPSQAILQLERDVRQRPSSELVYALAELNWIEGRRLEDRLFDWPRNAEVLGHFIDTSAYAYDYLFSPELAAERFVSDPRFRLAIDLYNMGVDRLVRVLLAGAPLGPDRTYRFRIRGREHGLVLGMPPSIWSPDDIHALIRATDFEVSGLPAKTHQYGLGVPLIAVRRTHEREGPESAFNPPEMAFPLTAFLRPTSKLACPEIEDRGPCRTCVLDLVDPVHYRSVGKPPQVLAIESDLSTPLAYMWSQTEWETLGWKGLLRPEELADRSGLMLVRPYEPGKIPVVMIHGLGSNPLAWVPMINELLGDSRITSRFQFFVYMYPTGAPIPIAAAELRETLYRAAQTFNPVGSDPAFDQMVLMGHSMGGLLAHAMIVHSDNQLWRIISNQPIERIKGPRPAIDELIRYTFFEPVPWVRRVVFLATPHRGSQMASGFLGRLGASLIREPGRYNDFVDLLIRQNPGVFNSEAWRRIPNSIEMLDPDSPVLRSLLAMRHDPEVAVHSIIGYRKILKDVEAMNDGVVAYQSARFPGSVSELVVRSDHGVQSNPQAIQEVRRILLEHLAHLPEPALAGPVHGDDPTPARPGLIPPVTVTAIDAVIPDPTPASSDSSASIVPESQRRIDDRSQQR